MGNKDSDETLIRLNERIYEALMAYLPLEFAEQGRVRFGIFDKENVPDYPTVYVFLYDIQEDLALRHGQQRHYQQGSGNTLEPRYVHVRCCYLLTYWDVRGEKNNGEFYSQQMQVNNMALNALLNLKLEMTSAFVQVIAPSEHLSSLGALWQSLGDRPRLCLNFTVTVPIALDVGPADQPPRIVQTSAAEPATEWEADDVALQFKRALLAAALKAHGTAHSGEADWHAVRAKLARLQVTCEYVSAETVLSPPKLRVTGTLDEPLYEEVRAAIETLRSSWATRGTIDVAALYRVTSGVAPKK